MKIKLTQNTVSQAMDVVLAELVPKTLGEFAGTVGVKNVKSHFLNETDSKGRRWEELSQFTINVLRKRGGSIPLQDEGLLIGSTTYRVNSKGATIELSRGLTSKGQNIAEVQNKGGLLWNDLVKRNIRVPAREFAFIDKEGKDEIEDHPETIARKAKQ